tara:strand:- start:291 stop:668 length:378 start_codon:yes stop_codon:yes gene_type:complete
MKEFKKITLVAMAAMVLVLLTSCEVENIYEAQPDTCSTDVSSIAGTYISANNIYVELTIANNATMSIRQDGVHVSFATICIEGSYINATNIYDQETAIFFGFVLDSTTGEKLGIVLDGDVYYNWE